MAQKFSLFAGSSHVELGREVAKELGIELGKIQIEPFPDGEIGVQVLENVRGKDVFVLQSPAKRPNEFLMELFVIVDAMKRASAKSIVAVIPYFAYARQDRKEKGRVPITAKLVADLLEKAGVTRVLTMDLHTDQIQGFFNIPVDNLQGGPLLVEGIRSLGLKNLVMVSPDVGGSRTARRFAEGLKADLAIVDKRRVSSSAVEAGALIGDVAGKNVVLIDDICSTGGTLSMAAKVCRQRGAKSVYAAVSHGIFVGDRLPSGIDRFLATDSVPQPKGLGIQVVPIASFLAEAIDCLVSLKSISALLRDLRVGKKIYRRAQTTIA
jgi:ribose-phosphate pyrophosphokinase